MSIISNDKQFVANTYARFPLELVSGKGAILKDSNGKEYIDLGSGIAVNIFGVADDEWQKAVTHQLSVLPHTSNLYYSEPCSTLAELLCERTGMKKVFFSNSGAEANECAIKVARKYAFDKYGDESHSTIITLKNSFHGRTIATLKATGQDVFHTYFGPFPEGFVYAEANNFDDVKKFADTDKCIAVMMELVQGEGGVHPATMEFMTGLRKYCDEHEMLLLIDEVQTGWCRTGAVMSYMNYGIKPDIVSMANGAICATAEVAKAFTPGSHGTTFGGHPVSCAAALAEVNELIDRDLAGNAKKVGDYFAKKLEEVPHVKEVRHQGLLVGVEFDDTISGVEVKHGCLDRKLLITAIGAHIIRMIPPLIVNEEQCDQAVAIIKETVEALSK